jgi:hypothetical protein
MIRSLTSPTFSRERLRTFVPIISVARQLVLVCGVVKNELAAGPARTVGTGVTTGLGDRMAGAVGVDDGIGWDGGIGVCARTGMARAETIRPAMTVFVDMDMITPEGTFTVPGDRGRCAQGRGHTVLCGS